MADTSKVENIEKLLETCARVAAELDDGHFTIYKFTTGWKVVLGTPEMSIPKQFMLMDKLQGKMTLRDALLAFLRRPLDLSGERDEAARQARFEHGESGAPVSS